MKITLRKADAIAKAALDAARRVPLESTVSVSAYSTETVSAVAETARDTLRSNLKVSTDLLEAAYQIRAVIGEANRRVGIDDALTEKAQLDAREKVLSGLATTAVVGRRGTTTTATDFAVAEKQREALQARLKSDHYSGYGDESVTVRVLDDSLTGEVQTALADIRKQKIAISDRLLELNMSTKVSLDASVVETLTKQGLI
jgi:hypothetical protein